MRAEPFGRQHGEQIDGAVAEARDVLAGAAASSRDVPVIREPVGCCRLSGGELLHEGGVVAYGPVLDALAVDDADDVHLLIGEASACGR